MKIIIWILILCLPFAGRAQSFKDSIEQYRKQYTKELLEDKRAPVKGGDVRYLRFFAPDRNFCVWADFKETPGTQPFLIPTHSGKQKPYRQYGVLTFTVHDTTLTLSLYQSIDLINDVSHNGYLFLPFTDLTNYETTYAGGRYLDIAISDIVNGRCLLDFNKCYNPYCAYADGFSCPIPPQENSLHVAITAGEKLYVKNIGE